MKKFLVVFIVSFFVASLSYVGFFCYRFISSPMSTVDEEMIFEIEPGKSFSAVSKELWAKGFIRSTMLFSLYGKYTGNDHKIKTGEYLLNKNMNPKQIISILVSGKSIERKITFSEGLNIFEIADLIQASELGTKEEFFKLISDKQFIKKLLNENLDSLEGYLFPETYLYTKYMNLNDVITMMVKRFLVIYEEVAKDSAIKNWKRHQTVTLASIIEKETGAGFERPVISSVFHNRLKKNMLLQTDPTVLYGMAVEAGVMSNNIKRSDLLRHTAYNTYVIKGLPPGPIANPGKLALQAALNPDATEYLFFVSQNDGTHVFSKDLNDHNKAVRKYQLDAKARQGKSWRDLDKNSK